MFHHESNKEYNIEVNGKKENTIVFKAKNDGFNRDGAAPPPEVSLIDYAGDEVKSSKDKTSTRLHSESGSSGLKKWERKKTKQTKKWVKKQKPMEENEKECEKRVSEEPKPRTGTGQKEEQNEQRKRTAKKNTS